MPKATLTDVTKRITVIASKTEGILPADVDNAYFQRVENIINASGTGKLCTSMLSRFIFGGGFANKDFYKSKVNKAGLTADKLLRKQCDQVAKFHGVAFHFNYNLKGGKLEVNQMPFKHVRFTTPDNKEHPNMFAVYDDWGKERSRNIDWKKVDYIDYYNPDPEVIREQVKKAGGWSKYKGQILYWSADGFEYPLATGDAVLEDMQTEAETKVFKYRNVKTNFMPAAVIEVDQFTETDEGTTAEDERTAFMETLENFQGGDNALKLMLLETRPGGTPAKVTKFDIQDVDKLYAYTEESCRGNIIRNYLIPPVLLMAIPGKLGTAKEINEATQYYNALTNYYRIVMEELFTEAFTGYVGNVNTTGDYQVIPMTEQMREAIPVEFFPDVTSNERRNSIGLPDSEGAQVVTKSLSEIIGVGGTTSFLETLANPDLTEGQKIESLLLLFPITRAQATAAVRGEAAV